MTPLRCDGTAVLGPTEQVPAKGLQLCLRPLSRLEVTCAYLECWSGSGMGIQAANGKAKWGQKGHQIAGMNECNKGSKPHSKCLAWHDVLPLSLSLFCYDYILWGLLWYFPRFCKSLNFPLSLVFSGLLDTKSPVTEKSEQYFAELQEFRQSNRETCIDQQHLE